MNKRSRPFRIAGQRQGSPVPTLSVLSRAAAVAALAVSC